MGKGRLKKARLSLWQWLSGQGQQSPGFLGVGSYRLFSFIACQNFIPTSGQSKKNKMSAPPTQCTAVAPPLPMWFYTAYPLLSPSPLLVFEQVSRFRSDAVSLENCPWSQKSFLFFLCSHEACFLLKKKMYIALLDASLYISLLLPWWGQGQFTKPEIRWKSFV